VANKVRRGVVKKMDRFNGKFLITWMGVVTGSPHGRDDGYPERQVHTSETLQRAVETAEGEDGAEIFRLGPKVAPATIKRATRDLRRKRQDRERADLNHKIEGLMAKRDRLK